MKLNILRNKQSLPSLSSTLPQFSAMFSQSSTKEMGKLSLKNFGKYPIRPDKFQKLKFVDEEEDEKKKKEGKHSDYCNYTNL